MLFIIFLRLFFVVKGFFFIPVSISLFIFKSSGSFFLTCHPWPEAIVEIMLGILDEERIRITLQKERRKVPFL